MQNRECIVFKRTRDTQQRIHESCACLWMPGLFRLQPVVGWIHLYHTRTAVAFARWNFLLYCLRWGKIITPQNSFCLWRKILRKASIIFAQHKSSLWKWNDQHVRSVGQRKKSVPDRIRTYDLPNTGEALYPLELRRTHRERGHILGSFLTRVLHTARISNVDVALCGERMKDCKSSFFFPE